MAFASQHYFCNKCYFRTTQLSSLDDHLQVHASTSTKQPSLDLYFDCFERLKPLECTRCDFSTESLLLLRYHLVHNHDQLQFALKTKLKRCKKCGFRTHSNYLWIRHRPFGHTCKGKKRISKNKDLKWYQCEKCDFRTNIAKSLTRHVIYKHTPLEEINWHQCTNCPAKFKIPDGLKRHQKIRHKNNLSVMDRVYCTECDYSTPYKHTLARHFIRKHARPEEIDWVECYHCGAKFKSKADLKCHLKKHAVDNKQYQCDQCPFKTHRQDCLKSHIISRHLKDDEIKWSKCQHCEYKAKQKNLITRHVQLMHSESVVLVQCPHCDFKTRNKSLKAHIRRFHDDSALKCDLCDYRAKYESLIEIHKKNKHGVGDINWFTCEHCDFRSKYKQHLKYHFRTKHNIINKEVFQCNECNYNTRSKHFLTNHMSRVHKLPKVEATISCENCSFVTTTEEKLQLHVFNKHTVHPEEEKLNCSHCTYVCFNKRYLAQHLKAKHKIGDKIRWYGCDKCDYKSQYKPCLSSHMYKVHNEGELLECDQCKYKTGCPRAMGRHKKKHEMGQGILKTEKF